MGTRECRAGTHRDLGSGLISTSPMWVLWSWGDSCFMGGLKAYIMARSESEVSLFQSRPERHRGRRISPFPQSKNQHEGSDTKCAQDARLPKPPCGPSTIRTPRRRGARRSPLPPPTPPGENSPIEASPGVQAPRAWQRTPPPWGPPPAPSHPPPPAGALQPEAA